VAFCIGLSSRSMLGMYGCGHETRIAAMGRGPGLFASDQLHKLARAGVTPLVGAGCTAVCGKPVESFACPVVVGAAVVGRRKVEGLAEKGPKGWCAGGNDADVDLKSRTVRPKGK
jgi:hypothetical protein